MVKSIHKLKTRYGTIWEPICGTQTGSNSDRVTEDDLKVTCIKCLELLGMDKSSIIDFFDPHDLNHINAYSVLMDSGVWPKDFVPEDTIFPSGWNCLLAFWKCTFEMI